MDSVVRVTLLASHLLLRMDWSLLIAPKGISFITSDNPVVVRDPNNLNMRLCGFSSSFSQTIEKKTRANNLSMMSG